MNENTPIILLHGLGSTQLTLIPLKIYLTYIGKYKNIHNITYQVDNIHFEEALNKLDKHLESILNKTIDNPIFIGQSIGGLFANNLHKKGWNILKTITIGSPLHGARLLNKLENILPPFITKKLKKKGYEYLMTKEPDIKPEHPCHTITASWFNTSFDGCVFMDEAKYEDETNTHISWSDHRTIFVDPRLWKVVLHKINE